MEFLAATLASSELEELDSVSHRGLWSDSSVRASVPDASMNCSAASSAGLESAP